MMSLAKFLLGLISRKGVNGRLTILTYHQVFRRHDALVPWDIDQSQFREQVMFLKRVCVPLTLSTAVDLLKRGRLPPRAICITFDDGYADNHDVALPILRELAVPATFYVTTGFLNGGIMWNDRVIFAVRRLPIGQHTIEPLPPFSLSNDQDRLRLAYNLVLKMRYYQQDERDRISKALTDYAGVSESEMSSLMMTDEMVQTLDSQGMEIGAHTVTHPILSQLPGPEARKEIVQSKEYLEDLLQTRVMSFAYPNGRFGVDLSERDLRLAMDAGFTSAVTTDWGAASTSSNLLALPRLGFHGHGRIKYLVQLAKSYRSRDIHEPAKANLKPSG